MKSRHDWALGKHVQHEDGRTGRVVDIDDSGPADTEPYLIMRYEDDGDERELVAPGSKFEVIA